jgi:hypothetical protein
MTELEVFTAVPPSDANIDGPVHHMVYKRLDTPSDDKSGIYLHTIMHSKGRLSVLCCIHAGMVIIATYPCKYINFEPTTALGKQILKQFYTVFCDAFVHPEHMINKDGIPLKQNIIDTFAKYNATIKLTHRLPLFLGAPGLLVLAWNDETISFSYPTVEKLLSSHPIITQEDMIDTLSAMWNSVQSEPTTSETDD